MKTPELHGSMIASIVIGFALFVMLVFGFVSCWSSILCPPKYVGYFEKEIDQVFIEGNRIRLVYTHEDVVHQVTVGNHSAREWEKSWGSVPINVKEKLVCEHHSFDYVFIRDLEGNNPYVVVVWFDNPGNYQGGNSIAEIHLNAHTKLSGGTIDRGKFGTIYVNEIDTEE